MYQRNHTKKSDTSTPVRSMGLFITLKRCPTLTCTQLHVQNTQDLSTTTHNHGTQTAETEKLTWL
jgi:hypothetical protein